MNLKGFKETDFGLIPNDWNIMQITDAMISRSGIKIGPFGSQLKKEYLLPNGTYRVYGQENVYDDNFEKCYRFLDSEKFSKLKNCELKPGDFVISTMGTIGKCAIVPNTIDVGIMDSHLVRIRFDSKVNKVFLKYLFQSSFVQNQIRSLMVGGIMDGLSCSIIKKINILNVPIDEQEEMSKILSDMDNLIGAQEELLQKKKNIRTGAMQKLLTGQLRLKDFQKKSVMIRTDYGEYPSDWDLKPLGLLYKDISDGPFGSDLKIEHYTQEKEARIIQLSNIGDDGWVEDNTKYTTFEHAKEISRCIVPYGAIVIAKMMPAGRAILCPSDEKMYVLTSDAVKLIPNDFLDAQYFIYATKSDFYLKQIEENTQGSTRQRTSITKLKKILIPLPNLPEQKAIAEIISDMDKEIKAIQEKIEKYKNIKQGMMQQLLTGKIRLIDKV